MSSGNQPSKNSSQSIQLLLSIKLRWSLCVTSLAQAIRRWMGLIRVCFDVIPVRCEVCRIFFFGLFILFLPKPKIFILKNRTVEFASSRNLRLQNSSRSIQFLLSIKFRFSFYVTSVAQVIRRWTGHICVCFDVMPVRYEVCQIFFSVYLFFFFQNPKHLFKKTVLSSLHRVEINLRRIRADQYSFYYP